jgi:hypothetical protein
VNEPIPTGTYLQKSREEICEVFGENLTVSILEENKKDCAEGITGELLKEKLDELRKIVYDIPTAKTLSEEYERLGAKSKLSDIEIDDSKQEILFEYSPLMRNRLTLMRLRQGIKTK